MQQIAIALVVVRMLRTKVLSCVLSNIWQQRYDFKMLRDLQPEVELISWEPHALASEFRHVTIHHPHVQNGAVPVIAPVSEFSFS